MRKIFSLFAAILFAGSMMAVDFTLTSAAEVTKDGVTVTFAKGNGSNDPAWYDAGLRLYAKNTVTISSESEISAITFNWEKQGQKAFATATASVGSYTHPTAAGEGVWTGAANTVTFTLGDAGQLQLNTFTVTVGPAPAVATPVISGDIEFTDSVIVTMTCSTTGADIYYTTDGTTDPKCDCAAAPEYKKPIVIKETTTIMAAAYTGNDWSAVATKTFTKVEAPKNLGEKSIAEFLELKNTKDTCVLTGIVSNITNETYGNFDLVEIDNSEVSVYVYGLLTPEGESKKFEELDVEEGDTLTLKAVYSVYNNKPQAKNAVFVSVIKGEGGAGEYSYEYEPTEISTFNVEMATAEIEDYTADYGVVTIYMESEDGQYFANLEFIATSLEVLQPGTYPINDSEQEATFWASPGGDDEYDYGCYFGVMDGQYYNPYYMISGSVAMSADGLTVSAKSYFGSTINLVYDAPEEGVENIVLTEMANKVLNEGVVYVVRDSKIFTVKGNRVR